MCSFRKQNEVWVGSRCAHWDRECLSSAWKDLFEPGIGCKLTVIKTTQPAKACTCDLRSYTISGYRKRPEPLHCPHYIIYRPSRCHHFFLGKRYAQRSWIAISSLMFASFIHLLHGKPGRFRSLSNSFLEGPRSTLRRDNNSTPSKVMVSGRELSKFHEPNEISP